MPGPCVTESESDLGLCLIFCILPPACLPCPDPIAIQRSCGDEPHLDLSTSAFAKLAPLSAGVMAIRYKQVPCGIGGRGPVPSVSVHLDSATSGAWLGLQVLNAQYSVSSVSIKPGDGGSAWVDLENSWGATWAISSSKAGWRSIATPLSIRITSPDGQTIEATHAITHLAGGAKFQTNAQFAT